MNISACILNYLKQFGTVIVPKFGVFSLENSKAIINSENGSILPPSTKIGFYPDYQAVSNDLLEYIMSEKGISKEAAQNELQIQVDFWKKKLQSEQTLEIQDLGSFFLEDGDLHFNGNRLATDHPDFYGLEEIRFSDINQGSTTSKPKNVEKDYKLNKSILWIFLLIVPVAGIAYFGYTQKELLFGKKSFDSVSVKTKTQRIEKIAPIKIDSVQIKRTDSLKTDSLRQDSILKTTPKSVKAYTPKKRQSTWQK